MRETVFALYTRQLARPIVRMAKAGGIAMQRWNRMGSFATGARTLLAAVLVGAGLPVSLMAATPPVAQDFTNSTYVGGYYLFGHPLNLLLPSHTTWTGDVNTLTYTNLSLPAHGTVSYSAGKPNFYYCDSSGFVGTDSFTWGAAKGSLTSGVATCYVITTNCVPVAYPGGYTGVFSAVIGLPQFSVTHPDQNQSATFLFPTPPAHGTLSPNWMYGPAGIYEYTPNSDFTSGIDSFTWQISDGISTSAPALYTITLLPNSVPVANPVSCTANSGALLTPLFDPTTNYTHAAADNTQPISYLVMTQPANGTASIDANTGWIDYISPQGFVGTDTFFWAVSDGISTSASAQVTVTVGLGPPVPTNQTVVIAKNTPFTFTPSYTGGGGYICSLVKSGNPGHGTVVVTSGMQFCYTPNTNYVGVDSFTWKMVYSNATTSAKSTAIVTCSIVVKDATTNADWTQWRFDECRSAQTPMPLPNNLFLQWRVDVPTYQNSFAGRSDSFAGQCNDIDNCRPVQLGKQLFVSLMANDSVSAYNTDTGAMNWRYYASGAVRRPPVAMALTNGTNVVIFGCDDGYLYCLNAADGSELWKFRGAPNSKKAMVFGRLGSVWPIWGSPVAYQGRVYFVAGYLPTWGLFAYCLDAATGTVVWRSDGSLKDNGYNTSLGPLTFSADHTKIYGSVEGFNTPWSLLAATGAFAGHLGTPIAKNSGSKPYWYMDGTGANAISEPLSLLACTQTFTPSSVATLGVSGTVGSLLAGDGKLFVTTTQGSIYCFGGTQVTAVTNSLAITSLPAANDVWTTIVSNMLSHPYVGDGLALVWGVGSGRLVEELAKQATNLMIVAVDPNPTNLFTLRTKMDAAGWSGARVSTLQGNPMEFRFAPYQAALIASEDVNVAGYSNGLAMIQAMYTASRPFGGEIWLPTMNAQHTAITGWMASTTNLPLCVATQQIGFVGLSTDGFTQIQRTGLPDSALVFKPPFRVIAFDVSSQRASGFTLDARPIWGTNAATRGVKSGRDIYSWLKVTHAEPGYEPLQPPGINTSRTFFVSGNAPMINPVNNRLEIPPPVWKLKACVENFGYGMQRFSPGKQGAIIDSANYWGVFLIPEMRGCGSECFAVNGVANFAPDGAYCNCVAGMAYTQIGVVPVPDLDEEYFVGYQWSRSQETIQETPVRRIGINFGAPDQRYDPLEGLLWTHHPSASSMLVPSFTQLGQANPLLPLTYRGGTTNVYHNSVSMSYTNPANHNWVSASYVKGMDGITIPLATSLVATRVAAPPVMDGTLNDTSWNTSNCARIVPGGNLGQHQQTSPSDTAFVLARYDDTNLYVGAGLYLQDSLLYCDLQIVLNSREKMAPPVVLACGSSGKQATGIDTNAWQMMYTLVPSGTNYNRFQAELMIPWSALAAVGIWKDQLLLNANFSGFNGMAVTLLNGTKVTGLAPTLNGWPCAAESSGMITDANMSPVYFDTAKGAAAQATPHTVKLYFAEMEGLTNGQRVFDVSLQGQTVLTNFDVYATAGAGQCEVVQVFTNILVADHLDIGFVRHVGEPMLSGAAIIDTCTNANGVHIDASNLPPVAVISASATTGPAPLAVTLSARSSYDLDGQIVDCAWETGDGRLAKGSLIQHIFAEPGTYTVNLLVMDNSGDTASTNVTITVTAGAPAAFVCNIRAGGIAGGDYTTLTAWNNAMYSDLTSETTMFNLSSAGNYTTADNLQSVLLPGGMQGTLRWVAPTDTPNHAFVWNVNAPAYTVFHVSSKGSYSNAVDNMRAVMFSGGKQGTLLWVATNVSPMIAAVSGINGTGTLTIGTVYIPHQESWPYYTNTFTISDTGAAPGLVPGIAQVLPVNQGHTFALTDTGTAVQSLLFTVAGIGSYVASDDGGAVTFPGGGVGTLKHINGTNIAYITECRGTIQAGTVTNASGHTFTIADTGNPIVTAVAQCFNDWPTGLADAPAFAADWFSDANHCIAIRPAPGQGHSGMLKNGGNCTGFAIAGKNNNLDCSAIDNVRVTGILIDGGTLILGDGASGNRLIATNSIAAYGSRIIIANSMAGSFGAAKVNGPSVDSVNYYNCTGRNFANNATVTNLRYVNCLSIASGSGFATNVGFCLRLRRSHCVSVDNTATNFYLSEYLLGGNQATQTVSLVDPPSGDFRLAATDIGATGKGGPGLGKDIAGNFRLGPTYASGASQASTPGPQITGAPSATPNPALTNATVSFSVQATDSNTLSYAWSFGDGGSASGATVTYAYAAQGVYTAQVAISDGQYALTSSVVETVLVYSPPVAYTQTVSVITGTTNNAIALNYTSVGLPSQSLTVTGLPANGSLNYFSGGSFLSVPPGNALTNSTLYYTPTISIAGTDSFTWRISDAISTSLLATCTIVINTNIPIVVTNLLTVSTSGAGTGSVTLDQSGGSYAAGTVATLTAMPDTSCSFMGWSGALSGTNNPATLTMNDNYSVIANFGFNGSFISASAGAHGSISPAGSSIGVPTGASQTFQITPDIWYGISSVMVDGSLVGAPASYTFNNVQSSHAISASFYALLAPKGTPLGWLALHGYANELALDPNGVPVWKDYQTGIDPNIPGSGASYNIVPYTEGFENLNAWGGVYTNVINAMGWSGAAGRDQSQITNLQYTYTATNLPLPSLSHTNVLRVNAQGTVLTNSFGPSPGFDMSSAVIYLDMMTQFVPIPRAPATYTVTDSGLKGGLYVNTNLQLTVYHGVAATDGSLQSNTCDATSSQLLSGSWHRVTWAIDATSTNPANALAMFQLRLDGLTVTHPNAYDDSWKAQFQGQGTLPLTSTTGTWFRLATTNTTAKLLTALCCSGMGYLDDVAVSTNNPFGVVSGPYLLIVTSSGNGSSSLGAGPYVAVTLAAGANTQIVYTAADWNRISTLASNGVSLIDAVGAQSYTQTVLGLNADLSNAVAFALATSAQTGYTNVPTAWLTNWTQGAVQAATGLDSFSLHDKYVLGLDPTTSNSYTLVIEGCAPSGSNIVVRLRRDVTGSLANGGMKGYLILQAANSLTSGFTNLPAVVLTGNDAFDGTGHRNYTNAVDNVRKFYKAVVQ